MDSAPLGKVFSEDNETNEEIIKFKKESSSKKGIVHSIKLEKKKTHQGEIRFWESIKLWKKKVICLEKTSTKKKRKKEKEKRGKDTKDMREYWFINRHKRREIPWKIIQVEKDEQKWRFIKRKIQSNWGRWGKENVRYISSKKKSAFNQVKKRWRSVKLKETKNAVEWKPTKFQKKKLYKKKIR